VPPSGCLKFNYDAAVGPSFSSIALVARDWRGKVVLALSKKAYTMNPLQAKAEAILWGINVAISKSVDLAWFESDSKV
jgi:hypothetical protein